MYLTLGGLTLDDTVLPTGDVRRAAPGGNALYAAVGARLWGAPVGIVARVGPDYPQAHLDRLAAAGIDTRGIRRVDHPSFHLWVLHEGQGRRQIVYRLDSGANAHLDPRPADIPAAYLTARAAHICPIPAASQFALLAHLHAHRVPASLDLIVIPGQIEAPPAHRDWTTLSAFLPSVEEARAVWGDHPVAELLPRLAAAAPPCFALKLGAQGSLVRNPADGRVYHIPPVPVTPVDTTGAGDAYCGGFLVGLHTTGDAVEAALRAAVSASFVIEDFGGLHALDAPPAVVRERLAALRPLVRPIC